jgi:hypothetical protein
MNKEISNFKDLLKVSLKQSKKGFNELFDSIPDSIFERIYRRNFNSNIILAEQILTNRLSEIDISDLEEEIAGIEGYAESIKYISDAIVNKEPILFATDVDNDGSLGQANLNIFNDTVGGLSDNLYIEYTKTYPTNSIRGFNLELVDEWVETENIDVSNRFTMITVDNGINSIVEQKRIEEKYPNSVIIITDHHVPNEGIECIRTDQTQIVNPKYRKGSDITGYFKEKNISGACLIGNICLSVIDNLKNKSILGLYVSDEKIRENKEQIVTLCTASNMLDYVDTDIRLKPLKEYEITKYSSTGVLLNSSNSLVNIVERNSDLSFLKDTGVNYKLVEDIISAVKEQNIYSKKLINLYYKTVAKDYEATGGDQFFSDLLQSIGNSDYEHIDDKLTKNYISLMRPIVFNLSADNGKDAYQTNILNEMIEVYKGLKRKERAIMDELRENMDKIVNIHSEDNITVVTPKSKEILSVFNRKFMSKAFNFENKGFLMFADTDNPEIFSGSMRSKYKLKDILKNKAEIEVSLKIRIEYIGHEVAAGFFVHFEKGEENQKEKLGLFFKWLNKTYIEAAKYDEDTNLEYLSVDFESLKHIDSISQKIRANVGSVQSIPVLFKLKPNMYITDKVTASDVSIYNLAKDKKFGYMPIPLSYKDQAIILPVESIKAAKESNFSVYMDIGYMDAGAFMSNGIKKGISPDNIKEVKINNKHRRALEEFYRDHYIKKDDVTSSDNYSVDVTNKMLLDIPYFSGSKGVAEFREVEALIVNLLAQSSSDYYSICDVEATGLGKSPKLTNIGFLNLKIDTNSGRKISIKEFNSGLYSSLNGREFYLTRDERKSISEINKDQFLSLSKENIDKVIIRDNKRFICSFLNNDKRVFNKSIWGDKVTFNRELNGNSIALLVKNKDTRQTPALESLTNIDNKMLNKYGIPANVVDKILIEKFDNKKIIFVTHNGISYDGNVIKSNLPKFSDRYHGSLQLDSTLFSKSYGLAYADNTVVKINIPQLKNKFFYSDEFAEVSLKTFLESYSSHKVYPDFSGKFSIKKDGEKLYLIDKEKKDSTILDLTRSELLEQISKATLLSVAEEMNWPVPKDAKENIFVSLSTIPINYRKYGIEKMSEYMMVLKSMTDDMPELVLPKIRSDVPSELAVDIKQFTANFDFSKTINKNIGSYVRALSFDDSDPELVLDNYDYFSDYGRALVKLNEVRYERYRDLWIAQSLIERYDFNSGELNDFAVKVLSEDTHFPEEKIVKIYNIVKKYKDDNNLDEIFVEEKHNNIVHALTNDDIANDLGYGDVMLEGLLTLSLNNIKNKSNYNLHDERPRGIVLNALVESTKLSLRSELLDNAYNSLSARQGRSYKRRGRSKFIDKNAFPEVVKFKLPEDILPSGSLIYTSVSHEAMTKVDMNELNSDLNDLIVYKVMHSTLAKNKKVEVNTRLKIGEILKANDEKMINLEDKFVENFGVINFSRCQQELKKVADHLFDIANGAAPPNLSRYKLEYLDDDDFIKLKGFLDSLRGMTEIFNEGGSANFNMAEVFLEDVKQKEFQCNSELFGFILDSYKQKPEKFMITKCEDLVRTFLKEEISQYYDHSIKRNIKK